MLVRSIVATQIIWGQTYYVHSQIGFNSAPSTTLALLRVGATGVVYQNNNGVNEAYFDPIGPTTRLGSFNDPLKVTPGLYLNDVRGIGLVNSLYIILSGGCTGLGSPYELPGVDRPCAQTRVGYVIAKRFT